MAEAPKRRLNWFQARSPFVLGLSCLLAAGLFIWFKLRLVTGMPRTAYAVPEDQQLQNSKDKKSGTSVDKTQTAATPETPPHN